MRVNDGAERGTARGHEDKGEKRERKKVWSERQMRIECLRKGEEGSKRCENGAAKRKRGKEEGKE